MARINVDYSPVDMMIVTAARLITDGAVLMVGTQWPIIVALLAKNLHAPQATLCFEGGVVLAGPPESIPFFTGDPIINNSSFLFGESLDTLGAVLHAGRADFGLLSAASVDRFGNINTTVIGPYDRPKIRFGGSGGACDFGSLASKTIIILEHDRRRFPAEVDFITTPGYLTGRDQRLAAGLRAGTGPYAVVTTLGLFQFDQNGEMFLAGHHPNVTIDEVKRNVQWDLKVAAEVRPLEPPSPKDLFILKEKVDPRGMYLKNARSLQNRSVHI